MMQFVIIMARGDGDSMINYGFFILWNKNFVFLYEKIKFLIYR